jgi:acyl-CoA thioester hydrolase
LFKTTITPRISETDGLGHINNVFVPIWFEAARRELFKIFTPDLSFANWKMVLVNMNVDYVNQIYHQWDVDIVTGIQKIGNSSLVIYEEIYQNEKLCAKGTATYVNFNFLEQRAEHIPDNIRNQLLIHTFNGI